MNPRYTIPAAGVGALVLFVLVFVFAGRGWGYPGYGAKYDDDRGYHGVHGPGFFYFGAPRYYPTTSSRSGSLGGPGSAGRGPGVGK